MMGTPMYFVTSKLELTAAPVEMTSCVRLFGHIAYAFNPSIGEDTDEPENPCLNRTLQIQTLGENVQ